MIIEGAFEKDCVKYDRYITPSDWKLSAALIGMVRYFDFYGFLYFIEGRKLYYKYDYVKDTPENLERYYAYIENTYLERLKHYKILESMTEENREEIINKVYINPFSEHKIGYSSFLQPSCFRKTKLKTSRVLGYYVDTSRKIKSAGWNFTKEGYVFEDYIEFDYIPFGFTFGNSSCIINCNSDIESLIEINNKIDTFLTKNNYTNFEVIFLNEIKDEIPCPVEIVTRVNGKKNLYSSIFYREESKKIFDYMLENKLSNFDFFINTESVTINVLSECINSILNINDLDNLIVKLLKTQDNQSTNLKLIKINTEIYRYYNTR